MEQATIGRSLVIKGEVTGSEALYIDGKIEGIINLADNPRLDTFGRVGFPPIGEVTDGMAAVDALNGEYGETPSQGAIQQYGNAYLEREYPRLDYIRTARVAQEWR